MQGLRETYIIFNTDVYKTSPNIWNDRFYMTVYTKAKITGPFCSLNNM